MGHATYRGEPVHITWRRRAGRITLLRNSRGRWELTLPEHVPAEIGAQYLAGYAPGKIAGRMSAEALAALVQALCETWLPRFDAQDVTVTLAHLPGRWGRCLTAQRRIELNPDCAFLTPAQVEELLVHELCHLHCPDHSPAFWAELTQRLPDWPRREGELRSVDIAKSTEEAT